MSAASEIPYDRLRAFYEHGADHFSGLVATIRQQDWGRPTPCTDWTVRDLVNHLTTEALWVPPLLAGATVEEVGDRFDGDQLGSEPERAWTGAITAARAAVDAPEADVSRRTVHLSFGDVPAAEYVYQLASDLLIHGWDLARGLGADDRLHEDDTQLLWNQVRDTDLSSTGLFAPPVHVPEDANVQTKLLAVFGRAQGPRAEP